MCTATSDVEHAVCTAQLGPRRFSLYEIRVTRNPRSLPSPISIASMSRTVRRRLDPVVVERADRLDAVAQVVPEFARGARTGEPAGHADDCDSVLQTVGHHE